MYSCFSFLRFGRDGGSCPTSEFWIIGFLGNYLLLLWDAKLPLFNTKIKPQFSLVISCQQLQTMPFTPLLMELQRQFVWYSSNSSIPNEQLNSHWCSIPQPRHLGNSSHVGKTPGWSQNKARIWTWNFYTFSPLRALEVGWETFSFKELLKLFHFLVEIISKIVAPKPHGSS